MKRNVVITAIAILFSFSLAGCRWGPLYNVKSAHLGSKGKSLKSIGQDIKAAGRGLGWKMKDIAEGKVQGILLVSGGKHKAVVVITYNTDTFNITYADSTNLRYKAAGFTDADGVHHEKTIHPNYNVWVKKLEETIKNRVGN